MERGELRDLYLWRDDDGDGIVATDGFADVQRTLVPFAKGHAGFDLRRDAQIKAGYARKGRLALRAVIMRGKARVHLLDLPIQERFSQRYLGYLSYAGMPAATSSATTEPSHTNPPWSGSWKWHISNASDWESEYQPWRDDLDGRLLLAVHGQTVRGVVQYVGRHGDLINLPLRGRTDGHVAQWTSVSPLGLTRSERPCRRDWAARGEAGNHRQTETLALESGI